MKASMQSERVRRTLEVTVQLTSRHQGHHRIKGKKRKRNRSKESKLPFCPWSPAICFALGLFHVLQQWGAPHCFASLVYHVLVHQACVTKDLDHVEFFAGAMAITRSMAAMGRMAVGFEIKVDNSRYDVNGDLGFLNAINLILKIKPGGGICQAPVCSSWVWANRGASERDAYLRPLGRKGLHGVDSGNQMV